MLRIFASSLAAVAMLLAAASAYAAPVTYVLETPGVV